MFMFGTRNDADPLFSLDLECGFCQTVAPQLVRPRVTRFLGATVRRSHVVSCEHCGLTTSVVGPQLGLYAEHARVRSFEPASD